MANNDFARNVTRATFDFWQTAPNGVTLAAKSAELAKVQETSTIEQRLSFASTVVQTVDGLVRPVIELANISSQTTSSTVAKGAKILGSNYGDSALNSGVLPSTVRNARSAQDCRANSSKNPDQIGRSEIPTNRRSSRLSVRSIRPYFS